MKLKSDLKESLSLSWFSIFVKWNKTFYINKVKMDLQ